MASFLNGLSVRLLLSDEQVNALVLRLLAVRPQRRPAVGGRRRRRLHHARWALVYQGRSDQGVTATGVRSPLELRREVDA